MNEANLRAHALRFAIDEEQQQRYDAEMAQELVDVVQTETTSVLIPALKARPGEKLTKRQAAARRSSALKLVYRNVLVGYILTFHFHYKI